MRSDIEISDASSLSDPSPSFLRSAAPSPSTMSHHASRAASPEPLPCFTAEQSAAIWDMQRRFQADREADHDQLQRQENLINTLQGLVTTYQAIQRGSAGGAPVEKRIQAVAEPGKFEGKPADVGPWLMNMHLWLKSNSGGLQTQYDQCAA